MKIKAGPRRFDMKALSVCQIQRLDKLAIEKYKIPAIALMENAGAAVAREIVDDLKSKDAASVCIVCGVGNNAGDGFVAARHLSNAGTKVKIFLIDRPAKFKNEAEINFQILRKCRFPIYDITKDHRQFSQVLKKADIIIDAIFGVGLNRPIKDSLAATIQIINDAKKPIVAVDIPSGLDGTTGKIYGVCIKAVKTVTFSFPKKGFFINAGPAHTGKMIVADIGIPKQIKYGR